MAPEHVHPGDKEDEVADRSADDPIVADRAENTTGFKRMLEDILTAPDPEKAGDERVAEIDANKKGSVGNTAKKRKVEASGEVEAPKTELTWTDEMNEVLRAIFALTPVYRKVIEGFCTQDGKEILQMKENEWKTIDG